MPHIEDASILPVDWCKSSFSGAETNCVEVAAAADAVIVRDSKRPAGPACAFSGREWSAFIAAVKAGEFGTGG